MISDSAVAARSLVVFLAPLVGLASAAARDVAVRGVVDRVTVGVTSFEAGRGIAAGSLGGEFTFAGASGAAVISIEVLPSSFEGGITAFPFASADNCGETAFVLGEKTYGADSFAETSALVVRGAADLTNARLSDEDGSLVPKKSSSKRLEGSLRDAGGVTCDSDAPSKSPEGCVGLGGDSNGADVEYSGSSYLAATTLGGSGAAPIPARASSSNCWTYGDLSKRGDVGVLLFPITCEA